MKTIALFNGGPLHGKWKEDVVGTHVKGDGGSYEWGPVYAISANFRLAYLNWTPTRITLDDHQGSTYVIIRDGTRSIGNIIPEHAERLRVILQRGQDDGQD